LINVDFNDLCAVLRGRHEESSLATVEASGENRAHEVTEKLMAHPFLEGRSGFGGGGCGAGESGGRAGYDDDGGEPGDGTNQPAM